MAQININTKDGFYTVKETVKAAYKKVGKREDLVVEVLSDDYKRALSFAGELGTSQRLRSESELTFKFRNENLDVEYRFSGSVKSGKFVFVTLNGLELRDVKVGYFTKVEEIAEVANETGKRGRELAEVLVNDELAGQRFASLVGDLVFCYTDETGKRYFAEKVNGGKLAVYYVENFEKIYTDDFLVAEDAPVVEEETVEDTVEEVEEYTEEEKEAFFESMHNTLMRNETYRRFIEQGSPKDPKAKEDNKNVKEDKEMKETKKGFGSFVENAAKELGVKRTEENLKDLEEYYEIADKIYRTSEDEWEKTRGWGEQNVATVKPLQRENDHREVEVIVDEPELGIWKEDEGIYYLVLNSKHLQRGRRMLQINPKEDKTVGIFYTLVDLLLDYTDELLSYWTEENVEEILVDIVKAANEWTDSITFGTETASKDRWKVEIEYNGFKLDLNGDWLEAALDWIEEDCEELENLEMETGKNTITLIWDK